MAFRYYEDEDESLYIIFVVSALVLYQYLRVTI